MSTEEKPIRLPFPEIEARVDLTRFERRIAWMEREPIEEGKILFYGSSCFTRWSERFRRKPLEDCLRSSKGQKVCVNHGFGGSTFHELAVYYDRMVKAWKPRVLVLTAFLNDGASDYTAEEMMAFLRWICDQARLDMPGIRIYVTDYRPTANERTDERIAFYQSVNQMLLAYAAAHDDVSVIELSKEPFYYTEAQYAGSYRHINKSLFISDNVHFTQEGYDLLTGVMRRALRRELDADWEDGTPGNRVRLPFPEIGEMVDTNRYLANGTIARMEKKPIRRGQILFYGSSCFTFWTAERAGVRLEDALRSASGEEVCVNNGFGGATAHELALFYDRLVKVWKPRVLVLTTFINDFSRGYTPEEAMTFLRWICDQARLDLPGIRFYITDFRPSAQERTDEDIAVFHRINAALDGYAAAHGDVTVIPLSKEPLYYTDAQYAGSYRHIDGSIFIEDKLHFTPEGYARLTEAMRRALRDIL